MADALERAGWRVSMVARGATLEALRRSGLCVTQAADTRISRPQAGSPDELGVHDYVLLTVKAQVLPQLAPSLSPLIGPTTFVVSGTNGIPWWFFHDFGGALANRTLWSVDPLGTQDRAFPRQRILGSVVHASVRVVAPGAAEVVSADRLILGEPGGESSARLESLVSAFRTGGINALATQCIRREVWSKLWGNMTINPLSALTRCATAKMLSSPDVRDLCVRMMQEMQHCAQRLGLQLAMTPLERIAVAQRLGNFKTSMLVDLEAHRPLELDPQLGAVIEIAGLLEIPTPHLSSILALARLISP
jgi:2-dehydropantoate 2-reductase